MEAGQLSSHDLAETHGSDQRVKFPQFCFVAEGPAAHIHKPVAQQRIIVIPV